MLSELEHSSKVVGAKQVRRALADGLVSRLSLAEDADPQLILPLAETAENQGVEICWTPDMKSLGRACGIAVGTAAAAII